MRSCIAICVVASFCFIARSLAASGNSDAVAYQIDSAHDGSVTFPQFTTAPTHLWSVNLGHLVSYPLIAQGEVYVTVGDNSAHNMALDAVSVSTGEVSWSVPLTSTYWSDTAAYDSGTVFLYNNNFESSTMNAYNAATGKLLWSAALSGQYSFSSPPTAANGIVYTGGAGTGGTVYAYRETDGKLLWTSSVENGDNSSPAVTSTGVYVSYAGRQTYDFNPTTGAQNWHYNPGVEGGGGKTPVFYNGNLYVRDDDLLTAFNAQTGGPISTFNFTPGAQTVPAFYNGIGYINSGGGLDAFNAATGAVLWSKMAGSNDNFTSAPILINGIVFEVSTLGNVFEFNAGGAQVGMFSVGAGVYGPDEQNVSQPLTGIAAGDNLLAIPAGTTLALYSVPEPSGLALIGGCAALVCSRRPRKFKATTPSDA